MNRGLVVAGAALLVANALILGNVVRNRAGNPDAVVRLSERELRHWGEQPDGAEEILNLRLQWTMDTVSDGGGWFDREKLESLGVGDLPAVDDTTRTFGWMRPTRPGYVVLELAGPAWTKWLAAKLAARDSAGEQPPKGMPTQNDSASTRLMAVDFGLDPMALRQQYPERSQYLILPATFRADVVPAVRDSLGKLVTPARIAGDIDQLLPGTVHVPRPLRDSLLGLGAARSDSTTRFEVTLKVGRKWEAWVE